MSKVQTGHILKKLRELFDSKYTPRKLKAYIIYSSDSHQSEYTAPSDQRRAYVCGFNGSAGTCVVTTNDAFLWTDGRYFLQAEKQIDENWTLMKEGTPGVPSISDYLTKTMKNGDCVGTDPSLISHTNWNKLRLAFKPLGINLVPVERNLVDCVWEEDGKKPCLLCKPHIFDIQYAGASWQEKVKNVREDMDILDVDMLFVSSLDDIAWLFNLRGTDIHSVPVFKSYVIITKSFVKLFIDEDRLTTDVKNHLSVPDDESLNVQFSEYNSVAKFVSQNFEKYKKIWIDSFTPASIGILFKKGSLYTSPNPVTRRRAVKNDIEKANIIKACVKDAACLCEYFGYLQRNIGKVKIDEISGEQHLQSLRKSMKNYVMDSFDTISSVGPNGSIIHYKSSPETNLQITNDQIYLCDSGAHYLEGTTDITRTLHFGNPTQFEKETYTYVLRGHVAIARAVFPRNATGVQIDSFARQFLWRAGLEYRHGTGHGIGMCLSVHEGLQSISYRLTDAVSLAVGNLLSNEPGYYEDGKFGIRLESMIFVVPAETKYNYKNTGFLKFDTVSKIPFHRSLIDTTLLDKEEIEWINEYHKECLRDILPFCEEVGFTNGIEYLKENTLPL